MGVEPEGEEFLDAGITASIQTDMSNQHFKDFREYGAFLARHGLTDQQALEVMPKAKLNPEKAIELNPNLAEALASLEWYQFMFEFDRKGAEENFDKAIKLNPNYATAYHWFGLMMNTSLELDRSTVLLRKALELEPTSLIIPSNLALAYRLAGPFRLASPPGRRRESGWNGQRRGFEVQRVP